MSAEQNELLREDLAFMRSYVHRTTSIGLPEDKDYLIAARLECAARTLNEDSTAEVVRRLRRGGDAIAEQAVVEAMTTNETSFFRDPHFYELLEESIFPELIAARKTRRSLTIWCAAAASGQEPYSILMLLRERFPSIKDWNIKLVASDLSRAMIKRCKEGLYTEFDVRRGLLEPQLTRWFEKEGRCYRIKQELRDSLDLRRIHLGRPLPMLPPCDLILMRNVLIYFDDKGKRQAVTSAHKRLARDGYLALGTTEVLSTDGLPLQTCAGHPSWLLRAA